MNDWLTSRGESRARFAQRIGVTAEAVRLWCAGERMPRREVMARIGDVTEGQVRPVDFYQTEMPV